MNRFFLQLRSGLAAPIVLVLILAMIVIPLPPPILDILFVVNIVVSLSALMACIYAKKPLDFSIFPTVLLLATLMRLSLNIASTRVILLSGGQGEGGAGQVIESFGNFVIGGNFVVGLVIFIILQIINFVVITKGAERISEVGARFTLDSMPGKQMAVDADLGSGQITQEEAAERRKEIGMESQFHGNMDGASKFVKGDAIAGVLILFINIIGGMIVGVAQNGMSYSEALETFVLLSIGDGLVAILPSIIMALATAIIITRVSSETQLMDMVGDQLLSNELIPVVTGGIVALIGFIPGMPNLLFISMGGSLIAFGYHLHLRKEKYRAEECAEQQRLAEEERLADVKAPKELSLDDIKEPSLISLQLGGILSDIARGDSSELSNALRGLQKRLSKEVGVLIKGIHVSDGGDLAANEYKIFVSGIEFGGGSIPSRLKFAIKVDDYLPDLDGEPSVEPVFGLEGFWIMDEQATEAEMMGYEVLAPSNMICTHVQQAIIKSLPMMVDLDDVEKMVNRLQTVKPKLVEAALSQTGALTTLLRVIRELLREKVPVTQLSVILETMAEMSEVTLTFSDLLMHIRKRLAPWILDSIVPDSRNVQVITFSDDLQDEMYKALRPDGSIGLDPSRINELDVEIRRAAKNLDDFDYPAILLVNPMLRRAIFDLFGEQTEGLYVLDFFSFPKTTTINRATTIG